jgi:tRNA (uracil-5-)-methyltransferase
MYRCALRQSLACHPLYIPKASLYSAPAFLGLNHKNNMSDPLRAGQTRSKPDSGSSSPIGKKPRLELTPSETIDAGSIKQKLTATTSPRKSAKKEARKAKKKGLHVPPEPYSTDDVLWRDVISVLGQDTVDKAIEEGTECDSPFEFREELELEVHSLSSNGACSVACLPDRW